MSQRKPAGIFVAGTDTGVGKTVVAAGLLASLRAAGLEAVPMKPVQTGCRRRGQRLEVPDLEFVLRVAGLAPAHSERRLMAPYRFIQACSPHLAAAGAGRRVDLRRVVRAFRKLAARHAFVVVEGAGGLLVPLNRRDTMLDLMRALRLPVLLVARPGLGTINHTLLALRALSSARLPVAGVVFNAARRAGWGALAADNAATIARLGGVRNLGRLPHLAPLTAAALRAAARRPLGGLVAALARGRRAGRAPLAPRSRQC